MSNVYLPAAIYERLPLIYFTMAILLAVLASTALKWPLIALLVLAAMVIRRRRRSYRESQHWQRAATFIDRLERSRKGTDASKPPTVEIL